ncbi:MAG: hypothetical protein QOH10_887 [Actinomycetota bacterium]|nr:hypothetical protein [Actinomycetota bacterium]
MSRATRTSTVVAALAAVALLTSACHSSLRSSSSTGANSPGPSATAVVTSTTTTVPLGAAIVLTAQGRELDAYATTRPLATQVVVPSPTADRDGVDVSGQICFDPTDPARFVAVDRTAVADGQVGWGVFELSGSALGKLSAKETARLVPTFQRSHDAPNPFGCGFLDDGRLLTTDVGNRASGAADGQLVEWFPPFDQDTVASCKVAVTLAAPEGVLVDGDRVYVAESRGRGVTSFVASNLPMSARQNGGCTGRDATGAGLASGVVRDAWLIDAAAHGLSRPAAIAPAPNGNLYVSSPSNGVISEVSAAGRFVRRVLVPRTGEVLGRTPFSTGTPVGLAVLPDGSLYYADAGLVVRGSAVVPGLRTGTIRRIDFVRGAPQPPEVVDSGLQAPYGIGIWIPSS